MLSDYELLSLLTNSKIMKEKKYTIPQKSAVLLSLFIN